MTARHFSVAGLSFWVYDRFVTFIAFIVGGAVGVALTLWAVMGPPPQRGEY